ncbi:hypothetical protein LG632_24645, partial [Streptomyces sp. SMC 277]|nr:hypothetical protein [Streptomyces antimicrobicus]
MRNRVNALLCTLAVLGVLVGGWSLYGSYGRWQDRQQSRAAVEERCGGLVDASAVLRLSGGVDRVDPAGSTGRGVDLSRRTSSCLLDTVREVDGDRRTTRHFSLTVQVRPDPLGARIGADQVGKDEPFTSRGMREREDATARLDLPNRLPLGDGTLGDHGLRSVSVVAPCRTPSSTGATSVLVTAASGESAEAGEAELRSLGRLARDAAVAAARRLGCESAPPALPARLPLPPLDLGP